RHGRILGDLLLDLFEATLGELAALGLCTAISFPLQVVAESGELQLGALGGPGFGAARTVGAAGHGKPRAEIHAGRAGQGVTRPGPPSLTQPRGWGAIGIEERAAQYFRGARQLAAGNGKPPVSKIIR